MQLAERSDRVVDHVVVAVLDAARDERHVRQIARVVERTQHDADAPHARGLLPVVVPLVPPEVRAHQLPPAVTLVVGMMAPVELPSATHTHAYARARTRTHEHEHVSGVQGAASGPVCLRGGGRVGVAHFIARRLNEL